MALSHEDVREILRIIDESDLEELRVETEGFTLHVRKQGGGAPAGDTAADDRPGRGRRAGHDPLADARHLLPR